MTVRIVHGANEGRFSLEGQTVEQVARYLREVFNIPADASALVNGKEVPRNHVLADGDILEFVRIWGQKGGLKDYWSEDELREFFGEKEVQQMKDAGMKATMKPALSADEVLSWGKWLRDRQHDPLHMPHVRVDIKKETITVQGMVFDIDQQMAAVVKCLLDAKGERRSQHDMKAAYPEYLFDDRLDTTIRRKLLNHKSGIGLLIKSDTRGYRIEPVKVE